MFEMIEQTKRSPEERKLLVWEYLAALATFGVLSVVVWLLFFTADV
jgi:hypothetical protein